MLTEYSITPSELKEIIDLLIFGYECVEFHAGDVLYCVLSNGENRKEFEFVHC